MASDRANSSGKHKFSRKPPLHPIPPTSLLNDDRKKNKTSATEKVEECRHKNLDKMAPLSAPNSDELLQVYPFVETPLVSTLSLGRGVSAYEIHRQFREWQNQILYERFYHRRHLRLGGGVGEMKHSREEIYELSSVEDMIASFDKDNLF